MNGIDLARLYSGRVDELDISGRNLGTLTAFVLCHVVTHCSELRCLRIGGNRFGVGGGIALGEALQARAEGGSRLRTVAFDGWLVTEDTDAIDLSCEAWNSHGGRLAYPLSRSYL